MHINKPIIILAQQNNKPVKQKCNNPAVKGWKKGYYGEKVELKGMILPYTVFQVYSIFYMMMMYSMIESHPAIQNCNWINTVFTDTSQYFRDKTQIEVKIYINGAEYLLLAF